MSKSYLSSIAYRRGNHDIRRHKQRGRDNRRSDPKKQERVLEGSTPGKGVAVAKPPAPYPATSVIRFISLSEESNSNTNSYTHGDNYHAIFSDTQLNTPNPIRSRIVRLDGTLGLRMANEPVGPNQNLPRVRPTITVHSL